MYKRLLFVVLSISLTVILISWKNMLIESLSNVQAQLPSHHHNSTVDQPAQKPEEPKTAESQVDTNEFSQDRVKRLPDIIVLGIMKCGTGKKSLYGIQNMLNNTYHRSIFNLNHTHNCQ